MLNLLPPEIKNQRRRTSQMYATISVCVGILALTGLALAGLLTWNVIQQATINERQARVDQLSSAKKNKAAIIAQAALVEDRLKNGANYQEKRRWETILNEVALATPADTTLTTVDVNNSSEGKVTLSIAGSTSDRRSIVLFRDKLEASDNVVNAAIQSLSESTDETAKTFTFTLTADYQEKK